MSQAPDATSSPVSACDEWSLLEEVIVGRIEGAVVPDEPDNMLQATVPTKQLDFFRQNAGKPFPADQMKLAEDELTYLVKVLEAEGVKVRRPDDPGTLFQQPIVTPDWQTKGGLYAAMPRDNLLVVGDRIIEAPMSWRSRQREGLPYRALLQEYRDGGSQWIQAPTPKLKDDLYTKDWELSDTEFRSVITEVEPTFDAADFLRFGRDVVGQRSHVTNEKGIAWLRELLRDEYRVQIIEFADAHPMHVDATIMPLRPGLMLINPIRVPQYLADELKQGLFKGWEMVNVPEPIMPDSQCLYMTSKWITMNVLSIDESRVIVEAQDEPMIALFKSLGLTPIPVPFRNFNAFGGSFHCATCDVRRAAGPRDWLNA